MFGWFSKIRRRRAPLAGAPAIRRQKSYPAQSGYVYQYFYEGMRPVAGGHEYVFSVSADRSETFSVSVYLPEAALEGWMRQQNRELSRTERYAIAKLTLFRAFDEREDPARMREPVWLEADRVGAIAAELDL